MVLGLEKMMSYRMEEPNDIDDLDAFWEETSSDEQEVIIMELRDALQMYLKFSTVEDLMRLVVNEVL